MRWGRVEGQVVHQLFLFLFFQFPGVRSPFAVVVQLDDGPGGEGANAIAVNTEAQLVALFISLRNNIFLGSLLE